MNTSILAVLSFIVGVYSIPTLVRIESDQYNGLVNGEGNETHVLSKILEALNLLNENSAKLLNQAENTGLNVEHISDQTSQHLPQIDRNIASIDGKITRLNELTQEIVDFDASLLSDLFPQFFAALDKVNKVLNTINGAVNVIQTVVDGVQAILIGKQSADLTSISGSNDNLVISTEAISATVTSLETLVTEGNALVTETNTLLADFIAKIPAKVIETINLSTFQMESASVETADFTGDACIYDPLGAGPIECAGAELLGLAAEGVRLQGL
jgi:uncharacterized protein YoxC